ncbi:hypothetical protein AMTR_s00101p00073580 [Amborella trichopoda]|uniref:Uncharacterized protein n=1 Tax=Amborella trichopoda TaxID=13333 RepID=W1NU01_AMBTC|nr:hypothetical protein AMTR_s00101p00073580 [Amborella trichopoda]
MKEQESYVPPQYIPLQQSDLDDGSVRGDETVSSKLHEPNTTQWSSGICACCDDIQSCCMGFMCPCYVFGKNAEFLGSGSWIGPCMIHFVMWGLFNGLCCLLTEGLYLGFPLSPASFYTYSYRKAIREKYNLPVILFVALGSVPFPNPGSNLDNGNLDASFCSGSTHWQLNFMRLRQLNFMRLIPIMSRL